MRANGDLRDTHHSQYAAMKLYHRTYHAREILTEGFRDGKGCYMTDRESKGVWFSDRPLDKNEGAGGDTRLAIRFRKCNNLITSEYGGGRR
jgi:hypothetical protein